MRNDSYPDGWYGPMGTELANTLRMVGYPIAMVDSPRLGRNFLEDSPFEHGGVEPLR